MDNEKEIILTENFIMLQENDDDVIEIWLDIQDIDKKTNKNPKSLYEDGFLFVQIDENKWRKFFINESKIDIEYHILKKRGGKIVFCNMQGVVFEVEINIEN